MNDIGIVIVNWNTKKHIRKCLESLQKSGYLKTSWTVVVDNDSTDDSVTAIQKYFPSVEVLSTGENLGYAGGNNAGIDYLRRGKTKYFFILNPDTEVKQGALECLREALDKNPSVGVCGPKIITPDNLTWSLGGYIDPVRYSAGLIGYQQENHNRVVEYIPGTAMLIKRETIEQAGVFYEPYFMYYEDVDWCMRVKKAGFVMHIVQDAVVNHTESSSIKKSSPLHQYYLARNHLLFVERHAPIHVKIHEIIRLPKTIWEHSKNREQESVFGIRDYMLRKFGKHD